ncbi:YraN family protein [Tellurirhabdus rosea]|uniref:YraN family protein n=1 Tax=Tellurirhabdus rosea TaxID=2674997 RepID=UPI0022574266|nr:YraN family protein [Tellurirhabdus rosea]
MAQHNETGKKGEEHAATYLAGKGFQILERNFRYQQSEIDLIARKDKLLLFVEVKTRTNLSFGNPEEFVSWGKARLIKRAAEHYIYAKDWHHDVRFDIVAVTIQNELMQVKHIEDAFN